MHVYAAMGPRTGVWSMPFWRQAWSSCTVCSLKCVWICGAARVAPPREPAGTVSAVLYLAGYNRIVNKSFVLLAHPPAIRLRECSAYFSFECLVHVGGPTFPKGELVSKLIVFSLCIVLVQP